MSKYREKIRLGFVSEQLSKARLRAIKKYRSRKNILNEKWHAIPDRYIHQGAVIITVTSVFSAPVAAQATNEASDVMCSSGLGPVITLAFGMITLGMILLSAFRGAIAVNKMGSARSDKKKEGREALKGAIITFLGAWFFPLFAVVIDKAGVSTLSCVNFANIM
ncbi:hypothetical protein [Haladaptatus sp. DYF46]|uniref:hypothetical protein n=1 Tax=Haladaptatus sp. DYF46 TaxID=2886041 RepID=UPI001E320A09|nr:hypothetical protein [Haladaptatus sp. DYF46]